MPFLQRFTQRTAAVAARVPGLSRTLGDRRPARRRHHRQVATAHDVEEATWHPTLATTGRRLLCPPELLPIS